MRDVRYAAAGIASAPGGRALTSARQFRPPETYVMLDIRERSWAALPLCVDLDGTLTYSDLAYENLVATLAARPWKIFSIPFWLLKGRANLKMKMAEGVDLRPELLPYNAELLDYLRRERAKGRSLYLVTGSTRTQAQAIADHLGLFDEVMATEEQVNLTGAAKAALLSERFNRYCYLGNEHRDMEVWKNAEAAGIVNAPAGLARRVAASHTVEVEIPRRRGASRALLKALRPHQWAKNLLVFVPIVTSNHMADLGAWLAAMLAFAAFSLVASGIYVLNDLTDLAADRRHLRKRNRPFASGRVPVPWGMALVPALLGTGIAVALAANILPALALYVVASLAYTMRFKEFPLVDVFCLAFLYVIRLFAGGLATGFYLSQWLLGFSAFLFLGLAFIKRVSELSAARRDSGEISRRGYMPDDLVTLAVMGVASSFASSILLALFVQSPEVGERYAAPHMLWALLPLILFWQLRLWLSTMRGYMLDDPIVYSARDWVTWIASGVAVAIMFLASHAAMLS